MFKKILILLFLFSSQVAIAADEGEGEAVAEKTPAYVSMGKSMVLNLKSASKKRLTFLQLEVNVLVMGDDAKEAVEAHIPAIRHEIILLLSEQKAIDMKTPAKRNDIRKLATIQVQELMNELAGIDDIEDVLFPSFLIQ